MKAEDKQKIDEWLRKSYDKNSTGIKASQVFASIFSESAKDSPEFALQIGLAVLMEKPIVIIAERSTRVPAGLLKIATAVERVSFGESSDMARVAATIKNLAKKNKEEPTIST